MLLFCQQEVGHSVAQLDGTHSLQRRLHCGQLADGLRYLLLLLPLRLWELLLLLLLAVGLQLRGRWRRRRRRPRCLGSRSCCLLLVTEHVQLLPLLLLLLGRERPRPAVKLVLLPRLATNSTPGSGRPGAVLGVRRLRHHASCANGRHREHGAEQHGAVQQTAHIHRGQVAVIEVAVDGALEGHAHVCVAGVVQLQCAQVGVGPRGGGERGGGGGGGGGVRAGGG